MTKLLIVGVLLVAPVLAFAQDQPEDDKKPKDAFVRIVNACTIEMREPWRAGLDLTFKDQPLAIDMRGAEAATYKRITFVGKDTVDVMATGKKSKLVAVPATFEKGGFYSIYLTGEISDAGYKVTPLVVTDFPVPPAKLRQGYARVNVFNAISTFPVKLQLDNGSTVKLAALSFTELYLTPGSHPYRIFFPYKSAERDMQGFLIVAANSGYSAIISASPEKADRPVMRLWGDSEQMQDAIEATKQEEVEAPPKGE